MRHGRRTDFTGFYFLFEVAHGDVTPNVPVKVDQYGVNAGKAVVQLGHVIVRLNLYGHGVIS